METCNEICWPTSKNKGPDKTARSASIALTSNISYCVRVEPEVETIVAVVGDDIGFASGYHGNRGCFKHDTVRWHE